jgi:hypothetical protein
MTILVELCDFSWKRVAQRDCFKAIGELYGAIPSNTPICQYLLKRLATHSGFGTWIKPYLESMPPAFFGRLNFAHRPFEKRPDNIGEGSSQQLQFP